MACCIFRGCFNKPTPFGTITFFNLPKDEPRRGRWLWLSGNAEVRNLPANARRLVCEEHFEERYLRRQFHRTTLARDAVPLRHGVTKQKLETGTEEILIEDMQDNAIKEEGPVTDQEEILTISADEETEYEVLVEEMPCEEGDPLQESNEDHETHLIDVEESYDGHEAIETTQNVVIGDGSTIIRCRKDAVDVGGSSHESKDVVDSILIDFEESCEEQKSHEIVQKTEEDVPHVVGEKPEESHESDETFEIDDDESCEDHPEHNKSDNKPEVSQPVIQEHNQEAKEVEVTNCNKRRPNVEPTQQTKKLKSDEIVEPDTSSQRDPSKPAVEEPSTSSCTSSIPAPATAPAPGKMSEEEYFAMSLVGPLQRLPPERRAIAKMKILTYLVQLECGMTDASL